MKHCVFRTVNLNILGSSCRLSSMKSCQITLEIIEISKNETRGRKEEVFCDFIQCIADSFVNVVDDETAVNFEIYEDIRLIFVPHFFIRSRNFCLSSFSN